MKETKYINSLIKSCQRRDTKAQRELYDLYIDRIYYIVRRYISDNYYINNIIQDIFLKIFNNIDKYDHNKGAFITWINTISVRASISHLRKSKLNYVILSENDNFTSQEVDILSKLNADDILSILSRIHEKYRIVFNLYEIDGYNHKEIAEIINITESSSRSYLTRAKKLLQEALYKTQVSNTPNYPLNNTSIK